jgi:hypothetical protein
MESETPKILTGVKAQTPAYLRFDPRNRLEEWGIQSRGLFILFPLYDRSVIGLETKVNKRADQCECSEKRRFVLLQRSAHCAQ